MSSLARPLPSFTPAPSQTVPAVLHRLPNRDAVAADEGHRALRRYLTEFRGRIAVVSSLGTESAVLLALVAEIDPATPVLFLDTHRHFPETLAYRRTVAETLGLTDLRDIPPAPQDLARRDPDGLLHISDPDACCTLRKVEPLERALAPFDAWVTGRKRWQSATRAALPIVELVDGRVKINPLAHWPAERIAAEMERRALPRHPLIARGFTSIGCAVCTTPPVSGGDPRSGRWAGVKTECGIHRPSHPERPAPPPART